jgi:hypothetical protein
MEACNVTDHWAEIRFLRGQVCGLGPPLLSIAYRYSGVRRLELMSLLVRRLGVRIA